MLASYTFNFNKFYFRRYPKPVENYPLYTVCNKNCVSSIILHTNLLTNNYNYRQSQEKPPCIAESASTQKNIRLISSAVLSR